MLQKIRDKSSGWVAGIIVGLLVLTFALFGINSYFGGGSEPVVAIVNDTEIKSTQFQRAFYNIRQQVQNLMGQSIPADDPVFKKEALNRLIDTELINQTTTGYGLRVSDQRVYEAINSLEMFRDGDRFDPALYQRTLLTLGMTETAFEQQMRYDMMSEQLQSAISESAFTIADEVDRVAKLKNQTRDFDYSIISVRSYMDAIETPDSDIAAYYEANKTDFVQSEQIKISYIDLTVDKVAEQIQLSEDDAENYFNANKFNYSIPERRQIWQAKIKIPTEFEGDAEAAAKEKADEFAGVFRTNTDFVQIAEQHSSAPDAEILVTLSESGEMKKGVLKAEIDEVLFSMTNDDVSEPIRSGDAFHVIKLIDVMQAEQKEFADVRDQVEKDLRRERAQRKYFDLAEQIAALTYEHPETLQFAADATELEIQESGYFSRESGEGLTAEPKIVAASFNEEVLINQNNSEPVELDPERMVVVRVSDRKPEGTKPLNEVRDQITEILKRKQAMAKVQETSQAILEKTGQGSSLSEAAQALDVEYSSVQDIKRDDVSVNRSVIRTAYRMGQPDAGNTAIDSITLGNGDVAIIELKEVAYSDEIKGKAIDAVTAELQQLRARMDWDGLFRQVKNDAEIRIFESNL